VFVPEDGSPHCSLDWRVSLIDLLKQMNRRIDMKQNIPTKSSGFTLIELLVVIAIIGILGSIIVAGVRIGTKRANAASCTHNLRMLHSAFMLATIDNKGKFPYADSSPEDSLPRQWHRRIGPYLDLPEGGDWRELATEVYICGADEDPYSGLLSYGINRRFMNLGQNNVSGSGSPVLIADADSFEVHSTTSTVQNIRYSHPGDTANMVFFDGSVRNFSEDEILPMGEDPGFWVP